MAWIFERDGAWIVAVWWEAIDRYSEIKCETREKAVAVIHAYFARNFQGVI